MTEVELKQVLADVSKIAHSAGTLLMSYYGKIASSEIVAKAAHDFVSKADKETEAHCLEELAKKYPDFDFLGEEGTTKNTSAPYRWIIDPLDGTTNFLRGIPIFAVSIALEETKSKSSTNSKFGKRIAGVVYNPATDEMWSAGDKLGAAKNCKRIHVNSEILFQDAILATGFPFRAKQYTELYIEAWRKLFYAGSSMRRCGAASVDLCFVAAGVLDGYWELNLAPWDIAAGEVIVREAGGMTSSFAVGDDALEQGCIWASPPQLHEQGLDILHSVFPTDFKTKE